MTDSSDHRLITLRNVRLLIYDLTDNDRLENKDQVVLCTRPPNKCELGVKCALCAIHSRNGPYIATEHSLH